MFFSHTHTHTHTPRAQAIRFGFASSSSIDFIASDFGMVKSVVIFAVLIAAVAVSTPNLPLGVFAPDYGNDTAMDDVPDADLMADAFDAVEDSVDTCRR